MLAPSVSLFRILQLFMHSPLFYTLISLRIFSLLSSALLGKKALKKICVFGNSPPFSALRSASSYGLSLGTTLPSHSSVASSVQLMTRHSALNIVLRNFGCRDSSSTFNISSIMASWMVFNCSVLRFTSGYLLWIIPTFFSFRACL